MKKKKHKKNQIKQKNRDAHPTMIEQDAKVSAATAAKSRPPRSTPVMVSAQGRASLRAGRTGRGEGSVLPQAACTSCGRGWGCCPC